MKKVLPTYFSKFYASHMLVKAYKRLSQYIIKIIKLLYTYVWLSMEMSLYIVKASDTDLDRSVRLVHHISIV